MIPWCYVGPWAFDVLKAAAAFNYITTLGGEERSYFNEGNFNNGLATVGWKYIVIVYIYCANDLEAQ